MSGLPDMRNGTRNLGRIAPRAKIDVPEIKRA
jgi:hypothetical protein